MMQRKKERSTLPSLVGNQDIDYLKAMHGRLVIIRSATATSNNSSYWIFGAEEGGAWLRVRRGTFTANEQTAKTNPSCQFRVDVFAGTDPNLTYFQLVSMSTGRAMTMCWVEGHYRPTIVSVDGSDVVMSFRVRSKNGSRRYARAGKNDGHSIDYETRLVSGYFPPGQQGFWSGLYVREDWGAGNLKPMEAIRFRDWSLDASTGQEASEWMSDRTHPWFVLETMGPPGIPATLAQHYEIPSIKGDHAVEAWCRETKYRHPSCIGFKLSNQIVGEIKKTGLSPDQVLACNELVQREGYLWENLRKTLGTNCKEMCKQAINIKDNPKVSNVFQTCIINADGSSNTHTNPLPLVPGKESETKTKTAQSLPPWLIPVLSGGATYYLLQPKSHRALIQTPYGPQQTMRSPSVTDYLPAIMGAIIVGYVLNSLLGGSEKEEWRSIRGKIRRPRGTEARTMTLQEAKEEAKTRGQVFQRYHGTREAAEQDIVPHNYALTEFIDPSPSSLAGEEEEDGDDELCTIWES